LQVDRRETTGDVEAGLARQRRRGAEHHARARAAQRAGADLCLPPLRRWDRRTAAAHGLAPQDINTGGDNDRGTD
jgi:hypothetical protein